jgi:hypothetical protein
MPLLKLRKLAEATGSSHIVIFKVRRDSRRATTKSKIDTQLRNLRPEEHEGLLLSELSRCDHDGAGRMFQVASDYNIQSKVLRNCLWLNLLL